MKLALFPIRIGFLILGFSISPLWGQGGPFMGMGTGPRFDGHMAKLFGDQQNFVCSLEIEARPADRPETISMPAHLSFSEGKSRLEMDLTRIQGGMMPPGMIEQVKAMGMAQMTIISRPESGSSVIIYPGLRSLAPVGDGLKSEPPDKFTLVANELGKETVEGQECVKSQVTVTGPDGKKFEATVWNSPRLKKFPVRVQSKEGGVPFTLTFKDVKFDKPSASIFETPAGYTKYEDPMSLMRGAMTKKLGEGKGAAPQ